MSTPQPIADPRVVRFGVFEADLRSGELRKSGARVRLQEQPFQVLAQLISRPGEIVTRDQLRQKLWPADTFVDFDHSLNTAINKIREALGDSASNPRFVETLARRGYRFIAPVQSAPTAAVATNNGISQPGAQRAPVAAAPPSFHSELEVPVPHRGITRGLFALIQVMYLVFYVLALFRWEAVDRVTSSFVPDGLALAVVIVVWVTGLAGIPLRLYLFNSAAFDHRRLGHNFRRLFFLILPLGLAWATAPFLLVYNIGVGAAFACTAALLYVPFSERTLIRLAYPSAGNQEAIIQPGR
jgi:cholera toxin transcriptional activator